MMSELWARYLAPIIFGFLFGAISMFIFARISNISGYKKLLSYLIWLGSTGSVIGGPITYIETVISKQALLAPNHVGINELYSYFLTMISSYLGGFGLGGLLVLIPLFRSRAIDQSFIDIFTPLRQQMTDHEVLALKLFLIPKAPPLFKQLISKLTRTPLPNTYEKPDLDKSAARMSISRAQYDAYLASGMNKLNQYLQQPSELEDS